MADKKNELHLNTKTHSSYSVVSFILGLLAMASFITAVIISAFHYNGTNGHMILIGLIAIVGMMANLSGLVFGIIGVLIKDYFKIYAYIGLVIHGLMLIAHIYVLNFGY